MIEKAEAPECVYARLFTRAKALVFALSNAALKGRSSTHRSSTKLFFHGRGYSNGRSSNDHKLHS